MTMLVPSQWEEHYALPGEMGFIQRFFHHPFYFPDSVKPGLIIDTLSELAFGPAGYPEGGGFIQGSDIYFITAYPGCLL